MIVWENPPQSFMSDSQDPLQPDEWEIAENVAPGEQRHPQHDAAQPLSPPQYLEMRRRHDEFIECLERHGSNFSSNLWPILAEELGWSVAEVQLYAYQYLTALLTTDSSSSLPSSTTHRGPMVGPPSSSMNGGNSHSGRRLRDRTSRRARTATRPWSLEEIILFETLVATYMPAGDSEGYEWEELVAAQLPGRTTAEVRRRWRNMAGGEEHHENHSQHRHSGNA
jgi:hypothetical protein